MVRKGEFLERMVVVQSSELALEALYHRGDREPPCVVAAPHPRLGGSMDAPVCQEVSWAISRQGHPTLRFNYRGVGASQGAWSGGPGEVDDCEAAARQLADTAGVQRVAIAGYSFGAHVALEVSLRAPALVSHLILIAPPTKLLDFSRLRDASARVRVVVPGEDPLCEVAVLEPWVEPGALSLVPEADHGFLRGLTACGRAAAGFLGGG